MDLPGHTLEVLRADDEFVVSRGQRTTDEGHILTVVPTADRPALTSLAQLQRSYDLRDDLDREWAARPLAFLHHRRRPVLVMHHRGRPVLEMEDAGGDPLDRLLSGRTEVVQLLRIAIGLAVALRGVHERGLVHKDIRPANVFADAASGRGWLTGFGIATRLARERQPLAPPEVIAGTLAYMAPEQTGRVNRSLDSRSDLYAFGITLYERFAGEVPFAATDPLGWVHCHIAQQPIPPAERSARVPAQVSAIVMRLLAKNAEDRYQTAAGGRGGPAPLPWPSA